MHQLELRFVLPVVIVFTDYIYLGIHRAERLMSGFFEVRNHNKAVTRCGQVDHGTHETERLLIINSYCSTVGFTELPFKVSAPCTANDDIKEYMGFSYRLPNDMHDVSNPTQPATEELVEEDDEAQEDQDGNSEQGDTAVADFLNDIFGDELDVEVVLPDGVIAGTADRTVDDEIRLLDV